MGEHELDRQLDAALRLAERWDAVSRRLESDDPAQDKVAEVYGRCADALLNALAPYVNQVIRDLACSCGHCGPVSAEGAVDDSARGEREHAQAPANPKDGDSYTCWCGVVYSYVVLEDGYAAWMNGSAV